MIHEVDEALRSLIREEALLGSEVEVVFDAPSREWAARRTAPTVDIYLYDIREDLRHRSSGMIDHRVEDGPISDRRAPARIFKLAYLITAWTQRAEDEHRLLSALLSCLVRYPVIPHEKLTGALAELLGGLRMTVGAPPAEDRQVSDVWSALGGDLKASLDIGVSLPVDPAVSVPAGPPVLEPTHLTAYGSGGQKEHRQERSRAEKEPGGFKPEVAVPTSQPDPAVPRS